MCSLALHLCNGCEIEQQANFSRLYRSINFQGHIKKLYKHAYVSILLYTGVVETKSRAQFLSNCRSAILSLPFLLIYSLTNTIWALTIWLDSLQLIPPHQDKGTAGQISLTEHLCLPYA